MKRNWNGWARGNKFGKLHTKLNMFQIKNWNGKKVSGKRPICGFRNFSLYYIAILSSTNNIVAQLQNYNHSQAGSKLKRHILHGRKSGNQSWLGEISCSLLILNWKSSAVLRIKKAIARIYFSRKVSWKTYQQFLCIMILNFSKHASRMWVSIDLLVIQF